MNKRGQDTSSIGLIITLVVVGLAAVLIIAGFTMGWSNLLAKINPFTSGGNVEQVKQACASLCDSKSADFCGVKQLVKFGKEATASDNTKAKETTLSCSELGAENIWKDTIIVPACSQVGCSTTPVA